MMIDPLLGPATQHLAVKKSITCRTFYNREICDTILHPLKKCKVSKIMNLKTGTTSFLFQTYSVANRI